MTEPRSAELVKRGRNLPEGVRTGPRSPDWMLAQLPVGMVSDGFFARFVSIFQEIGSSLLENADNVENLLAVPVAPPAMVRWMGSWIGVESIDESLPEDVQRRRIRGAAQTLATRGTTAGLRVFLEETSGGQAWVDDGGGVWREGECPTTDTAWVRMAVESTGAMPEADFVALVRDEVPAHVSAELFVGGRIVYRSEGAQ